MAGRSSRFASHDREPAAATAPASDCGEYELLEPIGRGGMGLVYRPRHVRLQRIVAVKVLPHLALADDSAIVRMQRETAAAGRVEHPNIVYATDAGDADGVHYLVMEHVPGIDLSKLVALAGPLPSPTPARSSARRRWAWRTSPTAAWSIAISSPRT